MFNAPLPHSHNPTLVLISIIIAVLASYTALELAGRVTVARKRSRFGWLVGGAIAMGIGIWSMHFTAMLAFKLPIPIFYNVPVVLISLVVAIVASGVALFIASRKDMRWTHLIGGGVIMGVAIAAMHYIGMAAMRLQAILQYDPLFFSLSIIIAITASLAALWLAFEFRNEGTESLNWLKIGSAVVMGGAISGMHYTGMHAAIFTPSSLISVDFSQAVDISLLGATSIIVGTFVVLIKALLLSIVDQRLAAQASHLAESEQRHNEALQAVNQKLETQITNLELVAKVGRATTSILDQDKLAQEVVVQIQSTFNYYHVHLYLFESNQNRLRVVGGTGEAGQKMLANRHTIAPGVGLVGRAAQTNHVVLAPDVSQEAGWLPNPLLPNTKAECATPIVRGEQVLGVLDVQNDQVNSLDQQDAAMLQLLANQVGVALHNAQLFEALQNSLVDAQTRQDQYLEQAWSAGSIKKAQRGYYHYARTNAPKLDETAQKEAKQAALSQDNPAIIAGHKNREVGQPTLTEAAHQAIVAPVKFRAKKIGNLQLYAPGRDSAWTADDVSVVEAVLDQLSQTAENLRLLEETRQRAGRERYIAQVSDKLRHAPDLETLMQIGVEELSKALGPSRAFMRLGSEAELAENVPPVAANQAKAPSATASPNGQGDQ